MKFYKLILAILIIFFKTGNVLSENNIFNVNNIEVEKKENSTNSDLANQAIKKAFTNLSEKILLDVDFNKLSDLKLTEIKKLVTYYQISSPNEDNLKGSKINFSVTFDKNKIHNLFYNREISYSEITNKELFILPIYKIKDQIFIFNQNYFYDNWNKIYENNLIEFILPLENIEIIRAVNLKKDNLIDLRINRIFKEYLDKNLALILIEENNSKQQKIYFRTIIQGKNIFKNITIKRENLNSKEFNNKIITEIKRELINLVKSQNLIDIRTPSFLNVKFNLQNNSTLVDLNSKIKKIDLIERIYVQDLNKDYINLKIKYLGKLGKIIKELKDQKINLEFINDQWVIKII